MVSKIFKRKNDLKSLFTEPAASKLPSWTNANKEEYSNFKKLINHAVMLDFDEMQRDMFKNDTNSFINKSNTDIMYISFKQELKNLDVDELKKDSYFKYKGRKLLLTFSERDYARSYKSEQELVYYKSDNKYIYFQQEYHINHLKLIQDEKEYYFNEELIAHQVWNVFDEEALLHDLERLPRESNVSLKERVNDKAANPSNSTYKGLKDHITRELGLKKDEVKLNRLSDESYIESLTKPNGMATKELKSIADSVISMIDINWNQTIWDESYWDVSENQVYKYITFQTDI